MDQPLENTDRLEPPNPATRRGAVRCLVVHDDLELRLRLAGVVRRALPALDPDCMSGANLAWL